MGTLKLGHKYLFSRSIITSNRHQASSHKLSATCKDMVLQPDMCRTKVILEDGVLKSYLKDLN